jgi:hypothetical protein
MALGAELRFVLMQQLRPEAEVVLKVFISATVLSSSVLWTAGDIAVSPPAGDSKCRASHIPVMCFTAVNGSTLYSTLVTICTVCFNAQQLINLLTDFICLLFSKKQRRLYFQTTVTS